MRVIQEKFVFSLHINSRFVTSIPHEGLLGHQLDAVYIPRTWGISGSEYYLSAIVNDMNRGNAVTSIVRGLLPRKLCDYNRPLTGDDRAVADKRLIPAYRHYHYTLEKTLGQALQHGQPILVDLHGFIRRKADQPDIVIGTCGGQTTRDGVDERMRDFFRQAGFHAHIALPGEKFSGGHTVQTYGKAPVSAIQIEIAGDLREKEASGKKIAAALRSFLLSL